MHSPQPGLFSQEEQRKKNDWKNDVERFNSEADILNPVDQLILMKHCKVIKYKLYKKLPSDKSAGLSSFTEKSPAAKQELRQ